MIVYQCGSFEPTLDPSYISLDISLTGTTYVISNNNIYLYRIFVDLYPRTIIADTFK
jgi:hypothetical protein